MQKYSPGHRRKSWGREQIWTHARTPHENACTRPRTQGQTCLKSVLNVWKKYISLIAYKWVCYRCCYRCHCKNDLHGSSTYSCSTCNLTGVNNLHWGKKKSEIIVQGPDVSSSPIPRAIFVDRPVFFFLIIIFPDSVFPAASFQSVVL